MKRFGFTPYEFSENAFLNMFCRVNDGYVSRRGQRTQMTLP